MFCSRQKQIRLLSINTNFCQFSSWVDSSFISLWIQGLSCGFEIYSLGTNSLVFVYQRVYRVYFLQASMTSPVNQIWCLDHIDLHVGAPAPTCKSIARVTLLVTILMLPQEIPPYITWCI